MKNLTTNLNELAKEHYYKMREQGFGGCIREKSAEIMDVVCELAEATEALRLHKYADLDSYYERQEKEDLSEESKKELFEKLIKDTFEDEITDAILRLLYIVGRYDIDVEAHINEKMWYNSTRELKHGKQF